MKSIEEIRLDNARTLAKGYRTLSEFAHKIERSPTQVSRFMGKNPTKKIGSLIARDIEAKLSLAPSYLDNDHSKSKFEPELKSLSSPSYGEKIDDDSVQVTHFDVRAAMGGGCVPPDYAEVITSVAFTREYLAAIGSSFTTTSNLAMVTGWGSSMAGTINHGDPVLVDRGIAQFVGDGVYLFTWDGLLYLKRLQKESKEKFAVISDSDKYQTFLVSIDDVIVHARAVLAWTAKPL